MTPLLPCDPSSTLPSLIEELVEEILIRIPPDEPAHLFRAALVCKPWRRILSDPGFLRRYRAFHRRRPPLLGFFCNDWWQPGQGGCIACFKPAAGAFPSLSLPMRYRHRVFCILDSRHGRVLLRDQLDKNLFVWDPISDAWQELRVHDIDCKYFRFVVLCAVAGCDHHDCRGGPFLVVSLGVKATDDTIFRVRVYSSEACAWGTPVSSKLDGLRDIRIPHGRAAVIGDKVYHVFTPSVNIVEYDLVKRCISLLISSPSICSEGSHKSPPIGGEHPVLTQHEDGSLGLASIGDDSRLYLRSSRMVNHDGKLVVEWVQERVIELDKILPIDMNKYGSQLYVAGFSESARTFFISTYVGTFTFELQSRRVRKITTSREYTAFPFISFFTPSDRGNWKCCNLS